MKAPWIWVWGWRPMMGIPILIQKPIKTKTGSLKEWTLVLWKWEPYSQPIPTADNFKLKKQHTHIFWIPKCKFLSPFLYYPSRDHLRASLSMWFKQVYSVFIWCSVDELIAFCTERNHLFSSTEWLNLFLDFIVILFIWRNQSLIWNGSWMNHPVI